MTTTLPTDSSEHGSENKSEDQSKDQLKDRIKEMIVRELNLPDLKPNDIGDDEPLFGDKFGLDSIDAVEIVFQVKAHFGVEIRDMKEGRPALETVRTLAAFIEARRSA